MEVIVLIKPDIIIQNKISVIKKEIEENLGQIEYSRMKQLDKKIVSKFYSEYVKEDFFPKIVENMTETPVIVLVVNTFPKINFNDILDIKKEIRKRHGTDSSKNAIHISDSLESVKKEKEALEL